MRPFKEFISIENLPPSPLTQEQKDKFALFLQKLPETAVGQQIKNTINGESFIILNNSQFSSGFPDSITQELVKLWVTIRFP